MSGMLVVSQDGGTHSARENTANLDEFEFLMLSPSKRFQSLDPLDPLQGVMAGPRRSIRTTTVAQRAMAKIQSMSMRRRLRLLLIHRRAATRSPRSKGR